MNTNEYLKTVKINTLPRIPLEGHFDLTYRCNNNCRHCWLRIPPDAGERKSELSTGELKQVMDDARRSGCRSFSISGGEPMLRSDFYELFDYMTAKAKDYAINTNGTLITPDIARLMKRKGGKMVALYGASAEIHDHITRNPGSYEAVMRGMAYLREAGAGFTVQLTPMKDNYHEFPKMIELARSLSRHYRVGAAWLYLSACGSPERNAEIRGQRLPPAEVIALDQPDVLYEEKTKATASNPQDPVIDDRLFVNCIRDRRDFHVDPYGGMSFCGFIKDPGMRYDLKKGSFNECWDDFIPSLSDYARGGAEYLENCGSCESRDDCRWCPVYGYLEHGRFSAKVDYLCEMAKEKRAYKDNWKKNHRRYFQIAGITLQVDSDLPITEGTFHPRFKCFKADDPGKDLITIRHHFSLPDLEGKDLGQEVYRKAPWAIYKNKDSWIYTGISPIKGDENLHRVVVFNADHTRARIYNDKTENFLKGGLHSLTLFATDQILIARVLADREGCYLHACGVDFEGRGLLFAGHSEAGKSTMATLLKGQAEILCDDRIIVRPNQQGYKIHGTWSHGDVPDVSAKSVPLKAILFLEKATHNEMVPIADKKDKSMRLLGVLIKPFMTADWWEKTLIVIDKIAAEVPCFVFKFDKSRESVALLESAFLKNSS